MTCVIKYGNDFICNHFQKKHCMMNKHNSKYVEKCKQRNNAFRMTSNKMIALEEDERNRNRTNFY